MRALLVALTVLILSQDIRAADDIKDFVQYQTARLAKYEDALQAHKKDKKPLIVWSGVTDSDEVFKTWMQTKDLGHHVFAPSDQKFSLGVNIGRDLNGSLVWFQGFAFDKNAVSKIKEACVVQFQSQPALPQPVLPSHNPVRMPVMDAPFQNYPQICLPGRS